MMTILFFILFFAVFGKILGLAFRATWGFMKILLFVVFLPLILVGMVVGGLVYIALPILLIVGLVGLVVNA